MDRKIRCLSCYVPNSEFEALDKYCTAEDLDKSKLLRKALKAYLPDLYRELANAA
jgi:hypothetical protein